MFSSHISCPFGRCLYQSVSTGKAKLVSTSKMTLKPLLFKILPKNGLVDQKQSNKGCKKNQQCKDAATQVYMLLLLEIIWKWWTPDQQVIYSPVNYVHKAPAKRHVLLHRRFNPGEFILLVRHLHSNTVKEVLNIHLLWLPHQPKVISPFGVMCVWSCKEKTFQ